MKYVHICVAIWSTYLCMYVAKNICKCICGYLKLSYFSGTLILVILVRGLVIAKFNACYNFAITSTLKYCIKF